MATILKLPCSEKGILILTCTEKDWFFNKKNTLYHSIEKLKSDWIIGLHPNGWSINIDSIELFDFILSPNPNISDKIKTFNFSAYNFSPNCFQISDIPKTWDILHIGRNHKMKDIPNFLINIKKTTDKYKNLNILSICPIPNKKEGGLLSTFGHDMKVRKLYNKLFDVTDYFNNFLFLTLNFEYPRPISINHLANFYSISSFFVDSTPFSLGSRTISYAIASGLPVVMSKKMKHMIPSKFRALPYVSFYESPNDIHLAIEQLITSYSKISREEVNQFKEFSNNFKGSTMSLNLKNQLISYFNLKKSNDKSFFLENLDIRLARHHGMGNSKSSYNISLTDLIRTLSDNKDFDTLLNNTTIDNKDSIESLLSINYNVNMGNEKGYKIKLKKTQIKSFLSKIKSSIIR